MLEESLYTLLIVYQCRDVFIAKSAKIDDEDSIV
jgi:hypothetical protein